MIATAPPASERILGQAVRLENLTHVYPGSSAPAISEIDLDIAPGELVCLLGPSGCGKSTLLRVVAGLLRPTAGRVAVGSDRHRCAIGWMAQRDGLLPWRTVVNNVRLPLDLQGRPRSAARASALEALGRVGLHAVAGSFPHQLSGGMRQRAALARALVHAPGLLLLDEPFAHLDELTRDELGDELVRLWADQRPTVILVTHSAIEAVRLADRVVVLSAGPARVLGEVRMDVARPRDETHDVVLAALQRTKELLRAPR